MKSNLSKRQNLAKQCLALKRFSRMAVSDDYPKINKNILVWRGNFTPIFNGITYTIEIRYKHHKRCPEVYLIQPDIALRNGRRPPHMYSKNQLCVFHSTDWPPLEIISEENLIGWISKWLYTYEIWQATGNWNADAINH